MSLRSTLRGVAESVMVRLPRTTRPGDRFILAYHNVVPNDWKPRGELPLHLPLHKFEDHLRILRAEADIVPLMDILTRSAPNERRVAITFDDAYASAMNLGIEACVAAGAASTVFVAPALFGTVPIWDEMTDRGQWSVADRERFLWQQRGQPEVPAEGRVVAREHELLRIGTHDEVVHAINRYAQLLTVGNHTFTHPNLGALSVEEVNSELAQCDEWIMTHAPQSRVPVVAYPFGSVPVPEWYAGNTSANDRALLADRGWISSNDEHPPLRVPRYTVPAGLSSDGFRIRVRGRLDSPYEHTHAKPHPRATSGS